jgi:transcriptional regulator with XRE-family HTH domain
MEIGSKIRNLRKKEKWTQKELAFKLDVANTSISDYELGNQAVSVDKLEKLCEIFEVDINYFLNEKELEDLKENKKRMIVEDLLDTLIERGDIKDVNNIEKSIINMLINVMKKDIEDKLKKQP